MNDKTQMSMLEHLESNCEGCGENHAAPFTLKLSTTENGQRYYAGIAAPTQDESKVIYDEQMLVRGLLEQVIGENSQREGLIETPKRVIKAWREMTAGYNVDIASLFKAFEDGAEGSDQMVVRQGIPVYSNCEHHLLPIFGHATVAYIPSGKVVGLSKMDRVVDALARRLQVQERLTNQIADAFVEYLKPKAVGVIIRARHMCVEARGTKSADSMTRTVALRGQFLHSLSHRAEFLALDK